MIEFEKHLKHYSTYWWSSFTKLAPEFEWGNIKKARFYLEKYWLPQKEYDNAWKPIQDKIFINQGKSLPELLFAEQYNLLALRGGCLFLEEDFKQLQQSLIAIGEKYFVVIENTFGGKLDEPAFRMRFPTDITWEELTSGDFISSVFFEMLPNEYFVFSESGNWGKYSANDYENPLDIIGFKPELAPVFKKHFKQPKEEQEEIREWLPKEYKKLIK